MKCLVVKCANKKNKQLALFLMQKNCNVERFTPTVQLSTSPLGPMEWDQVH